MGQQKNNAHSNRKSKSSRKRKANSIKNNQDKLQKHKKRKKMKRNTIKIDTTDSDVSMLDTSLIEKSTNEQNSPPNLRKEPIKYSITATPSKFIPNDQTQLDKHDQIAQERINKRIDELTKLGRDNARKLQEVLIKSEQKETETVIVAAAEPLNVCRNDEFGLPPKCTPGVMNSSLALSKIKRARKLEKDGKIKEASVEYKRAQQFFVNHKGIQKKIDRLTLELEAPDVRLELTFDDDNAMSESIPPSEPPIIIKKKKKKVLKGKKNKTLDDALPDDEAQQSDDDLDVSMTNKDSRIVQPTNDCSYCMDEQRMLNVFNTYSIDILKSFKSIGPTKAKAIISHRPFAAINEIRKVNGFHTSKGWSNLVEKNRSVFEKFSASNV